MRQRVHFRRAGKLTWAAAVCVALALPGAASAQRCIAPPGLAGLEQYCESIPGAGGQRGPADGAGSPRRDGSGVAKNGGISGRTAGALLADRDGAALFGLIAGEGARPRVVPSADGRGGEAGDATAGTELGSGPMNGVGFPLVLASLALLLLGALYLSRRRRAGASPVP